jgi:hypothetical protein
MPAQSDQEREFPQFSRSLILQECVFEQRKFDRRNQTHAGPDRELRLTGRIALQNRLIDSMVQSAESHIPTRELRESCKIADVEGWLGPNLKPISPALLFFRLLRPLEKGI